MWEFLFGFAIGVYFWRCRFSLVSEITMTITMTITITITLTITTMMEICSAGAGPTPEPAQYLQACRRM